MTAAVNITRNVTESFSITIPGFEEINPPAGYVYSFAEFDQTLDFTVADPTTSPAAIATFSLGSPNPVFPTPTVYSIGGSSLNITATTQDCAIVQGRTNSFSSGGTGFWLGTERTGGTVTGRYKCWIPFQVNLAYNFSIVSATLHLVAEMVGGNGDCSVKIGCDNRSTLLIAGVPTTYDMLNIVTLTNNVLLEPALPLMSVGTTYDYNITAAVQEVLNTAAWAANHIMGVVIVGNPTTEGFRYIASANNTGNEPKLTITY